MAVLRLDKIRKEGIAVNLLTAEKVENGSFGVIAKLEDSNNGRDTYKLGKADGNEVKGEVVFVAHDGHRYEANRLEDGVDIVVPAGAMVRGYHLATGDVISVDVKLITGSEEATTVAGVAIRKGQKVKVAPGTYKLTATDEADDALAVVDEIEMLDGKVVCVIRFL